MNSQTYKNMIVESIVETFEEDTPLYNKISEDMAHRVIRHCLKNGKYRALPLAFNCLDENFPKDLTLKEQIVYYQMSGGELEE